MRYISRFLRNPVFGQNAYAQLHNFPKASPARRIPLQAALTLGNPSRMCGHLPYPAARRRPGTPQGAHTFELTPYGHSAQASLAPIVARLQISPVCVLVLVACRFRSADVLTRKYRHTVPQSVSALKCARLIQSTKQRRLLYAINMVA